MDCFPIGHYAVGVRCISGQCRILAQRSHFDVIQRVTIESARRHFRHAGFLIMGTAAVDLDGGEVSVKEGRVGVPFLGCKKLKKAARIAGIK